MDHFGPSRAARAFSNFDQGWSSPSAMFDMDNLATDTLAADSLATDNSMMFPIDMEQPQPQLPRTGTLDGWVDPIVAYTNFPIEDEIDPAPGNFCLDDPGNFSGSPSSWDMNSAFNIDPPLTPESPSYTADSFGISPGQITPFSPHTPIASSFPEHPFTIGSTRTRSSGRVPFKRTNTHSHSQSLSSQLRSSNVHAPQPRPTMHMRAMSHSAAMLSRPVNITMSPRTLRNSTLDAALAQTETPLHFHHVIATPFSSSAPSHPAPISGKLRRGSTPGDKVQSEDDESERKASPERISESAPPTRSRLHPPKQAPSTWQIFFTEYLQNYKSTNPERKLNVSQAAKDGGAAYKALTTEQKEIYKRKARIAKEEYERELAAWQRMLTPDDIRAENAFRSAQRKAGKSRRSNLKDPNAPKKPLSAYFMFLQWIRADPARVEDVFGDETETTRQSVLAAAKWRTLSDDEKKPFLAQAEREKLQYETARKFYEERTSGIANPSLYAGSGYMQFNSGSPSRTDTESAEIPHGRRGSSSRSKLVGGAAFGALMLTPAVFDEEAVADGDMDDMFNAWHHT